VKRIKWTLESAQRESNIIHNNKFTIQKIKIEKVGHKGKTGSYLYLKCNICKHENRVTVNRHLIGKCGCPNCYGNVPKTIKEIQKESNEIHNNNFIIINLIRKEFGNKGKKTTFIDIKCKSCGYMNCIEVNGHLNKMTGCGGDKCKFVGNRQNQIKTLKNNPKLANEKYKLYLLKFTNNNIPTDVFLKVGKTKKEISERFSRQEYDNYKIEELNIIEMTHLKVAETEDYI
jgi:hypothetical protein